METPGVGAILIGAALLGAVACGGNVDAGATADAGSTQPQGTTGTGPPGGTSADATEAAGDEPAGPGGYEVREDAVAADSSGPVGPREPVKVTYVASGAAPDDAMTLVFDGDRFAMHFGGGRIIQTAEGTIFCGDGDAGCFEAPGGDEMLRGMAGGMGGLLTIEDQLADEALPHSWERVAGRSIAGRDATCATFDAADVSPGETGTMLYCYDDELGIGLYWEGVVDGVTQSFEATAVSTPSDADFEPTGPVSSSP